MSKVSLVGAAVLLLSLGKALAQASSSTAAGTTAAPSSGGSSSGDPSDDCKTSTDFKYEVCSSDSDYFYSGSYNKGKGCCSTRETCVGPVKVKSGDTEEDAYQCSSTRKLEGMKVLKIVFIPVIFIPLLIIFDILLFLKCDFKGNHLTKAATWLIGFSWPLILSEFWYQGVWASFLAFTVAFLSCCSGMPKYVYRLAWAIQIFQVVLLLGPTETFHVPIFNQSLAGSSTKLIHVQFQKSLDANEAACSAFYEGFMAKLKIELDEKEANPDQMYGGLCDIGWLGFIQFCLMMQVVTLICMVLLSAPTFLDASLGKKGAAATGETKVISVMPTGGGAQDSVDKIA